MALTPGTRLGPYEVVAQIGGGGMGELYEATDTNLKRQVAIKVLPNRWLVMPSVDRMIPIGERHVRRAIAEYVEHYRWERNHQGIENELIAGAPATDLGGRISSASEARRLTQLLRSGVMMSRADQFNGSAHE